MELSVFQFSSPGQYLQAVYNARKAAQPNFSLAQFSKKVGFGSANYARLVISGKRNLTVENIHKVARALKLTFEETDFFVCLVHSQQASTNEERQFYRKRMKLLKAEMPRSSARVPLSKIFSEWYYPIVLLAVERKPLKNAVANVQKILPVGEETVLSLLKHFQKIGLLREVDGNYELGQIHQIFYDEKSSHLRQKQFLLSQLEVSRRMLQKTYEKGSRFYSHSFTISTADFEYYEERLRALLAEFTSRSDMSAPEEVAQLNMQFFKVSPDCMLG